MARRARARSARPCWCRRRGGPPSARPSPTRSARCSRCPAPPRPSARRRWSASQMAVDRINKSGGINGRPVELIVADYESKPDVGRRKAEKLVVEDKIDVHVGGFLSNVCLACMPVWEEHKIVNMIGVCLDTTITTTKCNRYTFRPFDYAPGAGGGVRPLPGQQDGQEMAHRLCRLCLGPVDARRLRRADQEGRRRGRRHHRHSARHRRHDAVPVEDHRRLRRPVRHLLRQGRGDDRQPGLRSRPDQEVQMGRRRRDRGVDQPAGARQQDRRLRRHQPLRPGARRRRSNTPSHKKFFDEAVARLKADRSVRSAARPLCAIELRGDERPQARHGEVGLPGPRRHA